MASFAAMVASAFGKWIGIWLFLGTLLASAQQMPEWLSDTGVPAPPEFGVRDDTDFLGRDSGAKRRISDRLRKLEEDHGYQLYLVIEPVLIGTSAPELAEELRAAWLPRGEGMVVVFETDTRALGVGQDLAAGIDLENPGAGIPNHEASAVVTRAIRATGGPAEDPASFIESLTLGIADGVEDYYQRRATPPPPERALRMSMLVVGSVCLLGLGAVLAVIFGRRAEAAGANEFRFPESTRPERLGAPFGGGHIASRSFAATPGDPADS